MRKVDARMLEREDADSHRFLWMPPCDATSHVIIQLHMNYATHNI